MKQYVVDAFTDHVFSGNPAAICVLEQWPADELMLKIAVENNLSETAFTVKKGEHYQLRWFTPGGEIDLCGHATLACAYVLMEHVEMGREQVTFDTLSGPLEVVKKDGLYVMDFPAYELKPLEVSELMHEVLGVMPFEAYIARDLLVVLEDEQTVREVQPDLAKMKELPGLLMHVTAQGSEHDCVSRSFAPKLNIPEDPVCGSGHCHIAPYWFERLHKDELIAYQASKRGGTLYCGKAGERVTLGGKAALYSIAELFIDKVPSPCSKV